MVGRDSDLSTLEDALLSALRGDGGVVIVGGEAGMGKTRIVGALSSRARRLGCAVIAGGCSEAELSLPYLPFLEAIGNYLAGADLDGLRTRLGTAAEELAQLFPQLGRPAAAPGDPAQAKMRLFESILMLLRDAASRRALLVVLEDLQWADPATRELLDYATRRLRSTNVLIVATYRTDEMHRKHALLPTIQGWRRNGQVEMVDLAALRPDQIAEMVCAIFEEREISDEFRDFLHARSEGNPFVLEEMLRDAIDRGDVYRTQTGWDRKALAEIRIPPTVRDAILQRLERLNHDDVTVLSAASVMGRSFDLDALAQVAQVDRSVALAALEASVTAQLIEQEDRTSGRYRFRHALTREAIYEDLVVPRRQQLHSRIADLLKERGAGAPVDLANHLFAAGRNEEAVAMCAAAADQALRAHALRDGAELLERAAPYIADRAERARMLCRAAEAYWINNEPVAAKRLLEQSVPELEAAGGMLEAAGYRVLLGRCWWELMRTDLAQQEFERARDVLEPAGPSEQLANAYIRMSGMAAFNDQPEKALEYARRGLDIAEQAGAPRAAIWSFNFMALAESGLGQVDLCFEHLDRSWRGAVEGDFRFQAANAVYNALWLAVHLGRGDQVARWRERIASMPHFAAEPWPPYARALIACHQGRIEDAIQGGRDALQKSKDAGHQKMVWRSEVMLAFALAEALRADESVAVMPAAVWVDTQDHVYDGAPRIHLRLAHDDPAGAEAEARLIPAISFTHASPLDAVAQATPDPAYIHRLLEEARLTGQVLDSPRVAVARGCLALYEGRSDEAVRELGAGVAGFDEGGFQLDAWHAARFLAEAELRAGDADGARSRLDGVVADATASGAHLAARLAAQAGERLGLAVRDPAESRAPAEPRHVPTGERMVSVLFADVRGYTKLSGESAPADLADRIASLQRWSRLEVERRSGIVDKFAGDATMATFNVSGQSVDHAVQAVRAAIAIVDKAALAGLPVGAGVAVGPAVVGNLAEGANLSVLGEVTNLAARLQAQAGAGEVLVSEEVYRRAQSWLEGQRLPVEAVQLDLKGFSPGLPAYRILTEVGAPAAV